MQQVKTVKGDFLFVPIFGNPITIYYDNSDRKLELLYSHGGFCASLGEEVGPDIEERELPDGYSYKLLCTNISITEEIASQIVGDNGMGCWDNYRLKKDEVYTCTSAISSFKCLLELVIHNITGQIAVFKVTNSNKSHA